jgi:thiol-disulfide isomerase/thioredoxin
LAGLSLRSLLLTAAVAAVGAVLVAGVLLREEGPAAPVASPRAADAVAFAGADVLTGERLDLAAYAGKPVVVNIWASWCSGCNAEAAALRDFAAAHPEAAFVGVNFQDSREAARGFYAEHGWTFPSVHDPEGEIARGLLLQGTPTTIFLGPDHREVARIVGETDTAGFARGLEQATAGT